MKHFTHTYRLWCLLLIALVQTTVLMAQEAKTDTTAVPNALKRRMGAVTPAQRDSLAQEEAKRMERLEQQQRMEQLEAPVDTAQLMAKSDSIQRAPAKEKKQWIPDPKKATWLALVIPGGGQIYNRKYWKLPIVYGGFVACAYALSWNNQMYSDYSQAYLDLMDDDPTTDSYMDFLPPNYNMTGNESRFQTIFKNKKDFYRRYRDLSIFCFIGVYVLSVIDAYVDAELSNFDISKDLGLRVEPTVIESGTHKKGSVGLQCSIRF